MRGSDWSLSRIVYRQRHERIYLYDPDQFTLLWLAQYGRLQQVRFGCYLLAANHPLAVCDLIDGVNLLFGYPTFDYSAHNYEDGKAMNGPDFLGEDDFVLPDPPPFPGAKTSVVNVTEEWPGQRRFHIALAAVLSILFFVCMYALLFSIVAQRNAGL